MSQRSLLFVFLLLTALTASAQLTGGPPTLSPKAQRDLEMANAAMTIKARTALTRALPYVTSVKPLAKNPDPRAVESYRNTIRLEITQISAQMGGYYQWSYLTSNFSVLSSHVQQFGSALGMDCSRVMTMSDESNVTDYLTLADATFAPNFSTQSQPVHSDPYGLSSPYSSQFSNVAKVTTEARRTRESLPKPDATNPPAKTPTNVIFVADALSNISSFATAEGPRLSQETDRPKLNARVCRLAANLNHALATDPQASDPQLQPKLQDVQKEIGQLYHLTITGREQFLPCSLPGC